jgi:hypothetical protein
MKRAAAGASGDRANFLRIHGHFASRLQGYLRNARLTESAAAEPGCSIRKRQPADLVQTRETR